MRWRDFQPVRSAVAHVLRHASHECCPESTRIMEAHQFVRGRVVYAWFEHGIWAGQIVGREKVWYAATEADVDRLIAERIEVEAR